MSRLRLPVLVLVLLAGCTIGTERSSLPKTRSDSDQVSSGSVASGRSFDAMLAAGCAQVHQRNYTGAVATFRRIEELHPGHPDLEQVRLLLSACQFEAGRRSLAISQREGVASQTSSDSKAQALQGLARMELTEELYEKAAGHFEEAARLETDNQRRAAAHYLQGAALQSAGKFSAARAVLRTAGDLAPGTETARQSELRLGYPDHFAVQTGAFKTFANAEDQRRALAGRGFPAESMVLNTVGGKLYCVRVGKFSDRKAALALQDKLRAARVLPAGTALSVRP